MFHENVRLSHLQLADLKRSAKSFNTVEANCRRTTNAALVSSRALLVQISHLEASVWTFKTNDPDQIPAYRSLKPLA